MLNDGLTLSVIGIGIVFAVLAALALAIKGISLLDREPASSPSSDSTTRIGTTAPTGSPSGTITGQQVAAIAVAFALSELTPNVILSSISTAGINAGAWLQSGRMRVLGTGSSNARERHN
ncbi:MAG: OadG family protein [Chloroflexi bacterium]|nr:OadG family protein [Chloroflexota bacterium]